MSTTTISPEFDATLVGGALVRAMAGAGYRPADNGTINLVGRTGSEIESFAASAGDYMPTIHRLYCLLRALDEGASVAEAYRAANLDRHEELRELLTSAQWEAVAIFEYLTRPGVVTLSGDLDDLMGPP